MCCWTSRAHKHVYSLSCAPVVATPWAIDHQSPLFMGFPIQENWSGLPFPSSGDLPNPGVKPESPEIPALHGFFTAEPWGKTLLCLTDCNIPNTQDTEPGTLLGVYK